MVLTVSFVLSPVTGLVCHRRPRIGFVQARSGRRNSANLTPASGRQDHTTSPSAATSLVRTLCDHSQVFRLALQSPRAQNAAASTASHPASVTIAIRPSVWDGMRKVLEVIWGVRKQKYFCKWGWTPLSTNRPTGKSLHGSESILSSCPGRGAAFFTMHRGAGTHSGASDTTDPG